MMDFSKLTFKQLYNAQSAATLTNVESEYRHALKDVAGDTEAEFDIRERFERVIALLKSDELRHATRSRAARTTVTRTLGEWTQVARFPFFCGVGLQTATGLAVISRYFASLYVTARIENKADAFEVWAETNEMGKLCLIYKPGIRFPYLLRLVEQFNLQPIYSSMFWWLPARNENACRWWVNPLVQPVNTPDVSEYAKSLIYVEDAPDASR